MLLDITKNFVNALNSRLRVQGVFVVLLSISLFISTNESGNDLLAGVAFTGSGGTPSLRFQNADDVAKLQLDAGKILVTGDSVSSSTLVKIWIKGVDEKTVPPLAGSTESTGKNQVVFTPRFPLGAKMYVAVVVNDGKEIHRSTIDLTVKTKQLTVVKEIYPTADTLPENTLKFYLHFSAPMQKGDIYDHVSIREVGGKIVELPFLEIEQEFWSRDSKRLTLLLDPGRIKRGLKPREEMGPIFEEGKSYELVIAKDWKDAGGNEIGKEFVKRFKVEAEDHVQPTPSKWKVSTPTAGTKNALEIAFDGPLDHAMLQRSIRVFDSSGNEINGEIAVSENETVWALTPTKAWGKGSYKIAIDDNLEDPAGNSVGRQFDVDVFDKTEPSTAKIVELEFEIH